MGLSVRVGDRRIPAAPAPLPTRRIGAHRAPSEGHLRVCPLRFFHEY